MPKKLYPKCECQGWLSWLKLAKVCIISSLLHSIKSASHLNEILLNSLLCSLKPAGNLNEILPSSLLCSFKPTCYLNEIQSNHRYAVQMQSWKPWVKFGSTRTAKNMRYQKRKLTIDNSTCNMLKTATRTANGVNGSPGEPVIMIAILNWFFHK